MDQPYSRIADALLDYQYWSPNDPQKNPYDDTGWTFPEGFNVQTVRVTDAKVLDAPMERVAADVRSPGGVSGTGTVFAINHNADNALATLRYRFAKADFQVAEEAFDAGGKRFGRGSFIVKGVSQADLDKAAKELGLPVVAIASAPNVKTHPARAARVAIMHTWLGTQTEGWWRQAFDQLSIPFEYISTQDVAKNASLNAKYDVILFPPSGGSGAAIIQGCDVAEPDAVEEFAGDAEHQQADRDRRHSPGTGLAGLANLESFVAKGGVLVSVANTAEFAVQFGLTNGVSANLRRATRLWGACCARLVDEASPIVYGVSDNLAVYSDDGGSFSVSSTRGGRGASAAVLMAVVPLAVAPRMIGRDAGPAGGSQVRGAPRPTVQPWQAAPITDDQLRSPVNIIPPDQRPRVLRVSRISASSRVRFARWRERHRAAASGGGCAHAEGASCCSRTIRCGVVRRSAAMRSCSTRC
jgi:hypothetical protein